MTGRRASFDNCKVCMKLLSVLRDLYYTIVWYDIQTRRLKFASNLPVVIKSKIMQCEFIYKYILFSFSNYTSKLALAGTAP